MTIQVYPNIYKHEITLPDNPLKAVNSYIICSKDRNLIIDTGFNSEESKTSLIQAVKGIGIDLKQTSLLVTHLHSDHSGLATDLSKKGIKVYAGEIDGRIINEMTTRRYWEQFEERKKMYGLAMEDISIDDHPGYKYCPKEPVEFVPVKEGDVIQIGDYSFRIIDIPGHTPGHIGLYEIKHKLFFCGDHVLDKITPNITFWGFDQDILSVYFNSLKKVYEYDIDYLFTAHRNIIRNHKKRINELFQHHKNRLTEIIEILMEGKKTVRDTAASMHWDLRYDKWDVFPNAQKWFAAGEAMSHLEHLVFTGKAEKTSENGILYYRR